MKGVPWLRKARKLRTQRHPQQRKVVHLSVSRSGKTRVTLASGEDNTAHELRRRIIAITTVVVLVAAAVASGRVAYLHYQPVRPFLIYYGGLPSTNRDISRFVNRIDGYPAIILGMGLSNPPTAQRIMALDKQTNPGARFFGYISIGVTHNAGNKSMAVIRSLLGQWKRIGANGVLFDTAGPDFGVSHARLITAVRFAHDAGMAVIVNSWYPAAALDVGLTAQDGYLAENWYMADGQVRSVPDGANYVGQLRREGIPIYMTATGSRRITHLTPRQLRAWVAGSTHVAGGQYIAVADSNYSSQTDYVLPANDIHKVVQSFFPFGP